MSFLGLFEYKTVDPAAVVDVVDVQVPGLVGSCEVRLSVVLVPPEVHSGHVWLFHKRDFLFCCCCESVFGQW